MRYAICLLAVLSLSATAEIFRYVDDEGNVVFTDQPRKDAKAVEAAVRNTYTEPTPAAPTRPSQGSAADDAAQLAVYESINIVSPANDESLRENTGQVIVRATSEPPLRAGHTAVLIMDGSPVLSRPALMFTLENVDRGTHTVSVRIQSESGEVFGESEPSQFHLQRFSRLQGQN